MSKLEELIAELCPDGVKFKRLGECCHLEKGSTPIQKAVPGKYPLVVTTEERKSSNTYQFDAPTVCIPLVSSRGHGVASLNQVYYQDGKFALGNILCGVTPIDSTKLSASFLYHYLNYKKDTLLVPLMKGGANVSLTVDSLRYVKVPVPPIEVQNKVVSMLDSFIALSTELKAELIARKKQYEHYRDKLLTFDVLGGGASDAAWRTLGSLFHTIRNGFVGTVTSFYTDKEHGVRYIQGTNIHNGMISDNEEFYVTQVFHQKHLRTKLQKNDILLVQSGHIGDCAVVGEEYVGANCHALIIMSGDGICDSRYIVHYLYSTHGRERIRKITTGGTVKHILASKIKNLTVPVPPLPVQQRIVAILDRFDALCNDLTSGLPAEIEARKKQYEYYRDKLLTFKELTA